MLINDIIITARPCIHGALKGRPKVLGFKRKGGDEMSKQNKKKKPEKRRQPLIQFFLTVKLKINWPSRWWF
jgi:hypothetical protein